MEISEIRTLIIALTGLFLLLGLVVLIFFSAYKRNQNVKEKQIENLNKEILNTQLEIQEQTLKTISQEIHDNIGQVLSLAKLNLNTMDLSRQNELQEKILDSKNLVSKAIQDLRDLSRSLNTDNIAAMGLIKAIEYELEMIRKAGTYKTFLDVQGTVQKLDPQKELIVFRIVQEVLNNILKHADAGNISIQAAYHSQLELKISDDGIGFTMDTGRDKPVNYSLGLRNMENRAKMIGAGFTISSSPGKGTLVTLIVPFTA